MGYAKEIVLKVIPAKLGNSFVRSNHYSGKVVPNSSLHFGAFLNGKLHGVMQFGPPMDKSKVLHLVHTSEGKPVLWNEMLELNRMAFGLELPKNSESRCIAIAFRLMKKHAPHIKWVLSFADGTQCGDGTIYRASGFKLTQIKKNTSQRLDAKTGEVFSQVTFTAHRPNEKERWKSLVKLEGYQLRYVYLLDKTCKMQVSELPFSEIEKMGAKMYLGKKCAGSEKV